MPANEYKTLIYEPGSITRIIHNEPEKRNALTGQFILEFVDALKKMQRNREAIVGVILANGPTYCAGHNLNFVSKMQDWNPEKSNALTEEDWREQMEFMVENLYKPLSECPVPLVTGVQGGAYAGGVGFALACDIVVAANNALFDYGILHITGAGGDAMLGYFGGWRKALEMCLTGWNIDGVEAARIGLITKAVPEKRLEEEVMRYAKIIAAMHPEVVRLNKQAIKIAMNRMGANEAYLTFKLTNILGHLTKRDKEKEFYKMAREKGLKAAIENAHRPFAEFGYSPKPEVK